MVKTKIILCAGIFIFASFLSLPALDLSLRPGGFLFIPAGAGNESSSGDARYDIGGGGGLGFEVDLASVWPNSLGLGYTAGIEAGILYNALKSPATGTARFYAAGGALGFYYFPLSRFFTRLDGAAGVYQMILDEGKGKPALWWRAGAELGFRFSPMFTLAAQGGWRQYHSGGSGGMSNSGIYAGLNLQITFETGRGAAEGIAADLAQDDGVYPVFLSLYQQSPAGILSIQNNENAEIRNVRVSFRAGGYSASEFPCGTIPLLPKGRSAEVPLLADFSPELLRFTDNGRILGEVVIRYSFLGKEKETARTVSLQVYHRNYFPGSDAAGLAAFVSPTSPEVLEYAKQISGLARSKRRTGMNQNMQFAVWLFEGLREGGIRLEENTSGEIQFPAETLAYRTGSAVDLGLLYGASLAASGIPCALVPAGDEFLVACYLGINSSGAELHFDHLDRVLVIDDQVWMPLNMGAFNDGFTAAWAGAVEALNRVFDSGGEAEFIILENAWALYPPAPLPALGGAVLRPGEDLLAKAADKVLTQYVQEEITPLVQRVQRQINASPSAALYNRLGILLIRSGRTTDAKTAYERAAGMGSAAAMANRGNIAFIERDYAAAQRWYNQALAKDPENRAARRGLEQIEERRE